jgi:SAM-dependent methyltransferase
MRSPFIRSLTGVTIFASAFLLFQLEPLIAKMILPWFGGAAAVWTVCLLFFQVALLLGYLYAHLLTRVLGPREQGWVHVALLAASLFTLPIALKDSSFLNGQPRPTLQILWVLALTVGLPFFVLSTTSPLLQAWLTNATKDGAVYRLYALSNAGSLAGLLSYPLLVEPRLSTSRQSSIWSVAYAMVAFACGAVALSRKNSVRPTAQDTAASSPDWKTRTLWVALSACSSALLLAVTSHISQDIAAVPFVWVLPLSLYMLSFILSFAGPRWYSRKFILRLLAVAIGAITYALYPSFARLPFSVLILLFCAALFIFCMFCHGELARLKPGQAHLTSFYFLSALGGVIGAIFVAIVAPQLFTGFYELHVAVGVCALLVVVVHRMDPESPLRRGDSPLPWLALNAAAGAVLVALFFAVREGQGNIRFKARNFYGALRVTEERTSNIVVFQEGSTPDDTRFLRLMNGTISHGLQFLGSARRDQPTSYYGQNSGIGVTLRALAERGPLRVGVIGLGVGTIAAYGRAGDDYTFYEINPLVVRVAQQEFSFLQDTKAHLSIEMGDARVTLQHQPRQQFDVLALDAFSSDAIPVHLLTVEAFELYFRHLKPGGILAVHISNRYLNLEPVVAAISGHLAKEAVLISSDNDRANGIASANWILLANSDVFAGLPVVGKAGLILSTNGRGKLWTDSYSSLLTVLK